MIKCGCCRSTEIIEGSISISGGSSHYLRITKDKNIMTLYKCRICKACGNIMPFIDTELLNDN